MKAITMIQPWATLIALGEKRFETRSRLTHYQGDILIHAGKKVDKEACNREPFRSVLEKHGYTTDNLPTGAIIAKCILLNCYEVWKSNSDFAFLEGVDDLVTGNELAFGWYTEGRFAYELAEVTRIDPIPAKGQLGLWNYPIIF